MQRKPWLWCLLALLGLALPASGGERKLEGTYSLRTVSATQVAETPVVLLQIAKLNGTLKGAVLDSVLKDAALTSITLKAGLLQVVLKTNQGETTFEGTMVPKSTSIKGSYGNKKLRTPAILAPEKKEDKITAAMIVALEVPPMKTIAELTDRSTRIAQRYSKTTEADAKAKLLKEYYEVTGMLQKVAPGLRRETIAKYAESPLVVDAVLGLLRTPNEQLTTAEAKSMIAVASKVAAEYGKRYELQVAANLAQATMLRKDLLEVALEQATRAERLLDATSGLDQQATILTVLELALRRSGKTDEAKAIVARLEKMASALDREYRARVLALKVTPFAGRKGDSDRVVVMELFTGAQCPPCVTADVAFDLLAANYQPKDLVLIQYHMHIPGPDPLTNTATEARWAYYRKIFGKQISGVPSSLFNGRPAAGGGGGTVELAPSKYAAYRRVIDPLLLTPATVRVTAKANRIGDKINIEANVAELKNPGENVKLRLLLVEETVNYVGSNKVRLHHQVVRAFPGGVQGVALKDKSFKHTASIDLSELRQQLNEYLDESAKKKTFPNANRPMRFEHLRVIALVQDDSTAEILQATQVEVSGDKGGR